MLSRIDLSKFVDTSDAVTELENALSFLPPLSILVDIGSAVLNTSFRWGKGLEVTSPDTFRVFGSDRNSIPLSQISRGTFLGWTKDFSVCVWESSSPQSTSSEIEAAFQANTGHLWVAGSEPPTQDLRLKMMAGTSPSLTALGGGGWQVAFQADSGNLCVIGSGLPMQDLGLGMMPGTSPSITALVGGGWQAAFQANTGNLWMVGSEQVAHDMGLGMMSGTGPAI